MWHGLGRSYLKVIIEKDTNSVTSNYHNNSGGGWGSQELLDVSGIDSLIVSFNFKQA